MNGYIKGGDVNRALISQRRAIHRGENEGENYRRFNSHWGQNGQKVAGRNCALSGRRKTRIGPVLKKLLGESQNLVPARRGYPEKRHCHEKRGIQGGSTRGS